MATTSCLTWDRQSTGEHQRPYMPKLRRNNNSGQMAKAPMDCIGRLDWANGVLPAGRLWEEPEGIKSNCITSSAGFLRLSFSFGLGDSGAF